MKVVIVGGVAGGAGTATGLRRDDETAEIIILGRESYISYANCGPPYYIGDMITDKDTLQLQTPERSHARFNAGMRVGSQVVSVDTKRGCVVVRHGEKTYEENYDKLILSPGARPVQPGIPGVEEDHVFTPRNIPNTYAVYDFVKEHKPISYAVIETGLISLKMAENLTEQGIRVSVMEGAAHVMPPIGMDMAHTIYNYIRTQGIDLYLGHTCMAMDKDGTILDSGVRVLAGMVIMSIGVRSDTGFLKDSAIELKARGEILINQYMETSAEDAYAFRDAASVRHVVSGQGVLIPLAPSANKQGRIVGDNLYGRETAYKRNQGTSVIEFFDMAVAVTGEKEEPPITQERPYRRVITTSASQAGYYPGGGMMTIKTIFDPVTAVILGTQVVGGKGVGKWIDDLANAVRFRLGGYDSQETELAYTPPFSSAKNPVNMAGYIIGNVTEDLMKPFHLEDLDGIPEDAVRLDVRTVEEYAGRTIPGFINIPSDSLEERMDEPDLTRDICITCQTGLRDYLAQRILDQANARTQNLSGGCRFYEMMTRDRQSMAAIITMCTECGMEISAR